MKIICRLLVFLVGIAVCLSTSLVYAETTYQNAVHQLVIDKNKIDTYAKLVKGIGFILNKKYSYTEYADISNKNKVGIAGNYDYLLLSTGGSEWDSNAFEKYKDQQCGWETNFYTNHNLTVLHEVCRDQNRVHSWVRILKAAKGRHPDLYKE